MHVDIVHAQAFLPHPLACSIQLSAHSSVWFRLPHPCRGRVCRRDPNRSPSQYKRPRSLAYYALGLYLSDLKIIFLSIIPFLDRDEVRHWPTCSHTYQFALLNPSLRIHLFILYQPFYDDYVDPSPCPSPSPLYFSLRLRVFAGLYRSCITSMPRTFSMVFTSSNPTQTCSNATHTTSSPCTCCMDIRFVISISLTR